MASASRYIDASCHIVTDVTWSRSSTHVEYPSGQDLCKADTRLGSALYEKRIHCDYQ